MQDIGHRGKGSMHTFITQPPEIDLIVYAVAAEPSTALANCLLP